MDFTAPPATWIHAHSTMDDVRLVRQFLIEQGTFRFPALPNGLFSAAAGEGDDFEATGYRHVWVRDNIHIAHAHWATDQQAVAVRCVRTLLDYFRKHQQRFRDCISGASNPADPMQRPHIRFNGVDLAELDEKWSHAQNDALGYFLWLTCLMAAAGPLELQLRDWSVIGDLLEFWEVVRFWEDEDSGHWEETRKVAASSVGTATAGLIELERLLQQPTMAARAQAAHPALTTARVQQLIIQGRQMLAGCLPAECVRGDRTQQRRYDAALLFLIYPLRIADDAMALQILADVAEQLTGPIGIRRYPGDSYWCADYKTLLQADERTADFSDDLGSRDRLLKPGTEAQWCIFDPIVSVIYGERYWRSGSISDLIAQRTAMQRSLAQLTLPGGTHPAYRCPESYYQARGIWGPNDITPLLWTQANLWLGLHALERSLGLN